MFLRNSRENARSCEGTTIQAFSTRFAIWSNQKTDKYSDARSARGVQGFESDIVGVFWGRDFVMRDGRWNIGDTRSIYDNVDGLKRSAVLKPDLVLELVKNRYRIFLTRGIEGTLVYCEDQDTREFLLKIMNN